MRAIVDSARQDSEVRRSAMIGAAVLVAAALVVAATAAFAIVADIDGAVLTREPQVTLEGPVYAGFLSNLGALVWMVGVTMAALGWANARQAETRAMFLAGTVIGGILLFDDFFLFHDWLHSLRPGLDDVALMSYFVFVVLLIVRFRRELGPIGLLGVGATLGLLGISAVLDELFNDLDQLVEDGFKFLGICLWSTTWALLAHPWRTAAPERAAAESSA